MTEFFISHLNVNFWEHEKNAHLRGDDLEPVYSLGGIFLGYYIKSKLKERYIFSDPMFDYVESLDHEVRD